MSDPTENDTKEHAPLGAAPMSMEQAARDPAGFVAGMTETKMYSFRVHFGLNTLRVMLADETVSLAFDPSSPLDTSIVTCFSEATFNRLRDRFERTETGS